MGQSGAFIIQLSFSSNGIWLIEHWCSSTTDWGYRSDINHKSQMCFKRSIDAMLD